MIAWFLFNALTSIASTLLLVVVGAARRFPRSWFAWAGGLAAGLTLIVSFGYPLAVEPVFT